MSEGICINTKPDKNLDGYFQHLAIDFEAVNNLLTKDGCDLSYFIFNSDTFEEVMVEKQESGATNEELENFAKDYDKSMWEDVAIVLSKLRNALELVKGYDQDYFTSGKEEFMAELKDLIDELTPYESKKMRVQLLCA